MSLNVGGSTIDFWNISYSSKKQAATVLVEEGDNQSIYICKYGDETKHYEVEKTEKSWITDVFWLGDRVIALDSQLVFYDISHGKDIISYSQIKENVVTDF